MRSQVFRWCLALTILSCPVVRPASAQDNAGDAPVAPAVAPGKLVLVDQAALPSLAKMVNGAGGVSIRVSRAALEANAAGLTALTNWVRAGGVVFLHNDAAQLFGYTTVPGRQGSNRQGGQLYGRARAALGFNATPLLGDDGIAPPARRGATDPTRLPGVNVVFYEMAEGDELVTAHPAATPLLQVTDLTAPASTQTLYAAAIAPYGDGWAVFTPDFVDNRRADGALFLRNLLRLMPDQNGQTSWVGVSASAVEAATSAAPDATQLVPQLEGGRRLVPALPGFGTGGPAPAPVVAPAAPPQRDEAKMLLPRAEAAAIAAVLRTGDAAHKVAASRLLRARLEWQRGDGEAATNWMTQAENALPGAAETAFWRGCLWAGAGQNVSQTAPQRAEQLTQAATNLQQAGTAPRMIPAATGLTAGAAVVSVVPNGWTETMTRLAQAFAAEPPVTEIAGSGESAITVRHFANDDSYALSIAALNALARSNPTGWRADREEVLLFPDENAYTAYRRATGLTTQNVPLPAADVGDVIGSRIYMVGLPAFPTVARLPNGQLVPLQMNADSVNVLARLQAYVLMFALAEDGSAPPAWLRMGLENLLAHVTQGDEVVNNQDVLMPFAQAGGLLTPQQFAALQPDERQPPDVAAAQAASLVAYFYQSSGAGAVAETLQRLGSRQSVDDALQATTGGTQADFFADWRTAIFGPQKFPNRG